MMVMPSNHSAPWVHYWSGYRPKSVGHLYSPGGHRGPYQWLPFALDNGAFAGFDESRWRALLRWACLSGYRPLWVAVPDAVGDPGKTSAMWGQYYDFAQGFGWPLAFVCQDGHQAQDVPTEAEVVFVGGSTDWKRMTAAYWCERFPAVHIGRVNTYHWLRYFRDAGATSCDGTGFGRGDKTQLNGLLRFLAETHGAPGRLDRGYSVNVNGKN